MTEAPTETLKNQVAIVGAADTEVGIVPHLSATQLYVKAAKLALDDAGLAECTVTPEAKQFRQGDWVESKVEMLGQPTFQPIPGVHLNFKALGATVPCIDLRGGPFQLYVVGTSREQNE